MASKYFINKFQLASYIHQELNNPTPVKIQKCLYFCYCYYLADVANMSDNNYPRQLFKPNFVAMKYGPTDLDIFNAEDQHPELLRQDVAKADLVTNQISQDIFLEVTAGNTRSLTG